MTEQEQQHVQHLSKRLLELLQAEEADLPTGLAAMAAAAVKIEAVFWEKETPEGRKQLADAVRGILKLITDIPDDTLRSQTLDLLKKATHG
jgi:hypothetical protein